MNKSKWLEKLNEEHRLRFYKWEFLRRNEEYQLDYAAFTNEFGEWMPLFARFPPRFEEKDNPEAWSFFHKHVDPAAWKITEKWHIFDPTDPAGPFDGEEVCPLFLAEDNLRARREEEQGALESQKWDYFSRVLGDVPLTPKGLRFIQAQIDIAQPQEKIFEELQETIELARARYRHHFGPIADFRKRSRTRLEEYDSYLKVWDLRRQDLTFEQIAFQLFPKEMKNFNTRNAMTKRVRSHFQRAQKLIDGEYRQIVG